MKAAMVAGRIWKGQLTEVMINKAFGNTSEVLPMYPRQTNASVQVEVELMPWIKTWSDSKKGILS